jgi:rhamnosyltransferase
VCFNREVGEGAALYWGKENGSLAGLIDEADGMRGEDIEDFGRRARSRVLSDYSWDKVVGEYEELFGGVK